MMVRMRIIIVVVLSGVACSASAGQADVVAVDVRSVSAGVYDFDVTVGHADEGWDHYADAWRVVAPDGTVLGTRTLYHPHVDEQPFTRSLGGVRIPAGTGHVFVEAHDKVHGWSGQRLRIDLERASGPGYEVVR